jgi:hypothetical protein
MVSRVAVLLLVIADAGGQLVPVPVWFFSYLPMPNMMEPPLLVVVLDQFHSTGAKVTFVLI